MPDFSAVTCPEVFVSNASISKAVSEAVERGRLRKIGSRLYTRNLTEAPERLVRRNWYQLLTGYYPDALITDRTALENKPASDGSVFLVSKKQNEVQLPGLILRPRRGKCPIETDKPFIGGARLASTARAYLENMKSSRARDGRVSRTLARWELEERLEALLRIHGEEALNKLRDDARIIAPYLDLGVEYTALADLIGALLGTRFARTDSAVGKARVAGQPYDPDRVALFEVLFGALRETIPPTRPASATEGDAASNLAFFESYFSNFIEGTEFTVNEAREIVFEGAIPVERPEDAHDVLGTFRLVSNRQEMVTIPNTSSEFEEILRRRHSILMQARPDKNPGRYKTKINQAGSTIFVAPELVVGTFSRGFEFCRALGEPFHRAVFMMILVSEVHPFIDGNGRMARIMMNAELLAAGQERIIIPTSYRTDYLDALKAFSKNSLPTPVIRMLEVAQKYTSMIDWSNFDGAFRMLEESNAFAAGSGEKLEFNKFSPTPPTYR